ncbi:BrnA antitoxin family protein [Bosea sp. 685]|uniref:BrnA antitoxin family protein n=1 Tax=Bosea sp. 685 TaxID=3080057 RepID=UPI00289335C8|nr:BrnA antitoxin family protein [Bosea sp. 685]WNJ92390.1 BrnA antitoxin family protein [Bosea sp. 685]
MTKKLVPGQGYTKEDWDAVDSPELTDEELAGLRPMKEALPDFYAAIQEEIRKRGPARTKEAISIRLDIDLVEKLRASGPGWQSRVNEALRDWLERPAA